MAAERKNAEEIASHARPGARARKQRPFQVDVFGGKKRTGGGGGEGGGKEKTGAPKCQVRPKRFGSSTLTRLRCQRIRSRAHGDLPQQPPIFTKTPGLGAPLHQHQGGLRWKDLSAKGFDGHCPLHIVQRVNMLFANWANKSAACNLVFALLPPPNETHPGVHGSASKFCNPHSGALH